MNILSIGNSFSQDAQRYLHQIARADGVLLRPFNLIIGGCSLCTHYKNMLNDQKDYYLEMHGFNTVFKVSLKEALLNKKWDVVTIQQVSNESFNYSTYQPYLNELMEYVRKYAPGAKIGVHQTWAYEQDSHRLNVELGYADQADMFRDIKDAYNKAAKDINADFIIPSGEVFQELISAGVGKLHRDTFHASLSLGRYALGLTWYKILTGNNVLENKFTDTDEALLPEEIEKVKECVEKVCKEYKSLK